MKCKGCRHKILDYHEMIIDVQPLNNPNSAYFWHVDCFIKMVFREYREGD